MVLMVLFIYSFFNSAQLLGFHPGPAVVSISFISTEDAYVDQGNPLTNYGSDPSLLVSPAQKRIHRTFVKFDLREIPPGAILLSTLLKLYVSRTTSVQATYECSVVGGQWSENQLKWSNQPSVIPGSSMYSTVPQAGKWMSWDVRTTVGQFLAGTQKNFGWCIKDTAEGAKMEIAPATWFTSRENPGNKPKLEISFYPPKLLILGPSSADAGDWVNLRIERMNYEGNLVAKGDLRVQLSSTSASGSFSLTKGGAAISEVIVPDGKSYVDLYYIDENPGTIKIKADTNQFREGFYEAGSLELTLKTKPVATPPPVIIIPPAPTPTPTPRPHPPAPAKPKDTEGPDVKITAAPEKARETDVISISMEAEDPSGITYLKLFQSGTRLEGPSLEKTLINEFPCKGLTKVSFKTSSGPFPGMHTLHFEVEAADKLGNIGKGTAFVTIIVPPPKRSCGCKETHKVTVSDVKVYTKWDSLETGDVLGDERGEAVVAQDDEGGSLYIYTWNPEKYHFELIEHSEIRYTPMDRLAIGDVLGDGKDEILTVVDEDGEGGTIYIYQLDHYLGLVKKIDLNSLGIKYTHFDALLVGNVLGNDGKDEIIIARDDDEKLFILDNIEGEVVVYMFTAPTDFDEFRYTHKTDNEKNDDNGHDEIAVGNVLGDETDEIIYADNYRNKLYIFSLTQTAGTWILETVREFDVEFTKYDAMCVGDVLGNSRAEILIFRDEDRVTLIYDPFLGAIKLQYIFYSKWDDVATGDLVGLGKDQILVGVDEHNCIYVSYSEEFAGGVISG